MSVKLVYMTAGSMNEARAIGNKLVASKLAACVNIIEGMRSIYRWEGKLQEDREVVLIAKTSAERLAELTEMVKRLHSYDCPCIVSLPADGGNPAFLDWIKSEVG
jgi:periplasmic divalent cation tolerance protein